MFDEIEKEYKKDLQEKRFLAYYRPRALIIVLVAIILSLIAGVNDWLVYACAAFVFIGLVIIFFAKECYRAHHAIDTIHQCRGFLAKLSTHRNISDSQRVERLVVDLARHNLRTKSDIKLTLDYFQSRLPINRKPNLLEWIFTAVITLSSIVIVTYDSSISTISLHRLLSVLTPTIIVALIILTPFIIAKLIFASISTSRNKLDTGLVQDLAYIYVNFDHYRSQLDARSHTSPTSSQV